MSTSMLSDFRDTATVVARAIRAVYEKNILGLLRARFHLEWVAAVTLASSSRREKALAQLREINARLGSEIDPQLFYDLDRRFHLLIAGFEGDDYVGAIRHLTRFIEDYLKKPEVEKEPHEKSAVDIVKEHDEIIEAIKRNDGSGIQRALRTHFEKTAERWRVKDPFSATSMLFDTRDTAVVVARAIRAVYEKNILGLLRARFHLEWVAAVTLARSSSRDEAIAQLRELNARLGSEIDPQLFYDLDRRFHLLIAGFEGDDYVGAIRHLTRFIEDYLKKPEVEKEPHEESAVDIVKEHDEIIEAIKGNDGSGIQRALRTHFEKTAERWRVKDPLSPLDEKAVGGNSSGLSLSSSGNLKEEVTSLKAARLVTDAPSEEGIVEKGRVDPESTLSKDQRQRLVAARAASDSHAERRVWAEAGWIKVCGPRKRTAKSLVGFAKSKRLSSEDIMNLLRD